MSEMLHSTDPVQSIRALMARGQRAGSTAFEQYASKVLASAGAGKLAGIRGAHPLKILAPENGRLAQIVHAGTLSDETEATVLSAECALNRLICIADAIADGVSERGPLKEEPRKSLSGLGGGYVQTGVGYRSARVVLPSLSFATDISPAYYNEIDWRCTDNVTSNGRAVFQRSMMPNPYRTTHGVKVRTGCDWDVRTRLAQILGALELPFRYSFQFDYDSASRTAIATFTCPPADFLPDIVEGGYTGEAANPWRAYECYLLRLACLFGCGCFGSGKEIERAMVAGFNATWKKPLISARFERNSFARSALAAIDSNEIASPALRFDPRSLAELIAADHLDWIGKPDTRGNHRVSMPPNEPLESRADPWGDERELPPEAQALFHCKRICDVDTQHYEGGHADAIDLARDDADESSIAAVMRLESLVESLEAETTPPDDDSSARPLYAADPLSRLAITLLDDERAVSAQAEAFLKGEGGATQAQTDRPRYFRAPSALYHARYGLSDLYQRMGDYKAAEMQANRCIALAPTTAGAYFRKADVLAERGFFEQAANVLIDGLRCCAVSTDCALLYYHLGMLLWNSGKKAEALAVHAYNTNLEGEYAAKSQQVLQGMRENPAAPSHARTSAFNASRELANLNLPVSPIDLGTQVTQATIFLTNAGNARAAAPYARELERHCHNDAIITAACRSIQFGATQTPSVRTR